MAFRKKQVVINVCQDSRARGLREATPNAVALKTSVPAVLYLVQHNMQDCAARYLDADLLCPLLWRRLKGKGMDSVSNTVAVSTRVDIPWQLLWPVLLQLLCTERHWSQ